MLLGLLRPCRYILLLLSLFSGLAFSQQQQQSFHGNGVKGSIYVGVGAGRTTLRRDRDEELVRVDGGAVDTTYTGKKLYLGYNIDSNWALEASFIQWGKLNFHYPSSNVDHEVNLRSYSLAVRLQSLINNEYYFFIKAGVQRTTDIDLFYSQRRVYRFKDDLIYGWGIDYPLGPSLKWRFEYEQMGTSGNNVRLISGGLNYSY